MKKTFYEKVGNKYVPVREYDSDFSSAFPAGTHLVVSGPGYGLTRYNIDPAFAPLVAAGTFATDKIASKISEASSLRLSSESRRDELTLEQRSAWEHLVDVFGDSAKRLEWPSTMEAAEAGVNALIEEANKKLQHPEVKKAYEQFLLVYSLAK